MIHATLNAQHLEIQCTGLQAAGIELSRSFACILNASHVYVLRGANGVGKSTLLRAIANAMPGQAVLFKPEYGLRDDMLVDQHVRMVLRHLHVPPEQLENLLTQVGLMDWQFERIGTLSSGQRARLGLCTLLARQFKVWLLDEPLNALDAEGTRMLAHALQAHLQAGGWVYMASHIDPQLMLQHMPGVVVHQHEIALGVLNTGADSRQLSGPVISDRNVPAAPLRVAPLSALMNREWLVLWANPQAVLWGALFHWMVLSFFGIGLGKPSIEFAQVAVWVSALLAVLLGAKDWFSEDHRVGWLRLLANIHTTNIGVYWLLRVLCTALAQILVLVPVTGLLALQFGLTGQQAMQLMLGLVAGVWAMAPLLGVIALLVMLTRGGAVLVYLIALPLLVPVLIFGLEASRAADFGRSASAPLAVMFSMGLLACLVGPALSRRLIQLIQE